MKKEQLAAILNGRQYRHEITRTEESQARAAGLLVIFGASDDLMELRGTMHDEVDANGGATLRLSTGGLCKTFFELKEADASEEEFNAYFAARSEGFKEVHARWDKDGFSWVIETEVPHSTFVIMEEDETYCRGVVISMNELFAKPAPEQFYEAPDHGEHLEEQPAATAG